MSTDFNKEKCQQRNRVAALRYGIDTASVKFLSGVSEGAPVEYRNYGGKLPETSAEALAMINAMLPEGAEPLTAADVYIHYVEAANNSFIADRYAFLGRDTLRNIARDGAAGAAFMNSHRTGGLSTDAEFPFGKTFAGQYQEGRDAQNSPVQRTLLAFYMLRGIKPNGDSAPSTDDLDRKIRGGTLFDVSVGLYGGTRLCDVCGNDLTDGDECPHIPGTLYAMDAEEIAQQKARGVPDGCATYTIKEASLGEVSGVFDGAVRGAGFRKALSLSARLKGQDLKLAREVYAGLLPQHEGEVMHQGLFDRLTEAVADGFRRAVGNKPPTPPPQQHSEAEADKPASADHKPEREDDMDTAKDTAEVERLRADSAELARIKRERREQEAKSFATDQIKAHKRLLPFGFQNLQAEYLQRAEDDERAPLAAGSRVENLRAIFAALPAHHLTEEQAAAQLPKGAEILDNNEGGEQALAQAAYQNAKAWGEKANVRKLGN